MKEEEGPVFTFEHSVPQTESIGTAELISRRGSLSTSSRPTLSVNMSASGRQLNEDQFQCSLCKNIFTDPVTIPCGHNFCKSCITKHWGTDVWCQCPSCEKTFYSRPELQVNTFISEMAAQLRQSVKIRQMIQKRREKIEELKQSVKLSEKAADRQINNPQVFTALTESVKRSREEFIQAIKEKKRKTEKQAEDFIKEMEQEVSELEKKSTEDHQKFSSLNAALLNRDLTQVRVHPPSYEGTVVKAVTQLEQKLTKQIKKLGETELKRVQQSAVDVTLDPDTAHPKLILSDDGREVKDGNVKKNLPDNPERFDTGRCVLAKQSVSSGRFYYEVQVKKKTAWTLGVARESINRKGDITASPQKGYWTICLRNDKTYKALAGPPVRLSLGSRPETVGVFVDYDEGLVSFYDVGAAALIYSFTGCSFTDKLHPYFSPLLHKKGTNSAPLIITPVSHTE